MKVLVLDNYDSFTYNIVHVLKNIDGIEVDIIRNDEILLEGINIYDKIILSPGPSLPKDAGHMNSLISNYYKSKPILGICLGHQAIAENFGASLFNLKEPYHGIQTNILVDDDYLFSGIDHKIKACRYHSWSVSNKKFPNDLMIIARDENDMIMGISHKKYDVRGIQFHPESIQTNEGFKIIENFINK